MANERQTDIQTVRMAEIAQALSDLRDSWIQMSLALGDMLHAQESPEREEVRMEVECYLARLREAQR